MARRTTLARLLAASVPLLMATAGVVACSEGPVQPSCSYAVTPATQAADAGGGVFQLAMATTGSCQWTAAADASWVTLQTPSGTGPGPVIFAVAANDTPSARTASLTVQGQRVEIRQEGLSCSYAVSPSSLSLTAAGGASPVSVTAPAGCTWTAASSESWISVSSSTGSGSGAVTVNVAQNTGTSTRSGSLQIAGQSVSVTQTGSACTFAVSPTSRNVVATGGTFGVAVTTTSGCEWQAASEAPWLSVSSSRGTGSGQVTVSAAANTVTSTRTGTVRIGGQAVTVTQEAAAVACAFTVTPTSEQVAATGGTFQVSVATTSACQWTASSSAPWVTINSGQSGTGSGSVSYVVAQNTATSPRTATLQVAGQSVTISQAAAAIVCSYTLSPPSQSAPAGGGPFQFTITTPSTTCQWTASSADSWITIANASGSGTATVSYTLAANPSSIARSGAIQAGGQTLAISQVGVPCSYAVNPTSQSAPATGGTFQVNVTSPGGCSWTAGSNASWLTVTNGASGTGNGTVSVSASANPSTASRSGTLTVAGQTVTATQGGATLNPSFFMSLQGNNSPTTTCRPATGAIDSKCNLQSTSTPQGSITSTTWRVEYQYFGSRVETGSGSSFLLSIICNSTPDGAGTGARPLRVTMTISDGTSTTSRTENWSFIPYG